jgi:hypothetical protein
VKVAIENAWEQQQGWSSDDSDGGRAPLYSQSGTHAPPASKSDFHGHVHDHYGGGSIAAHQASDTTVHHGQLQAREEVTLRHGRDLSLRSAAIPIIKPSPGWMEPKETHDNVLKPRFAPSTTNTWTAPPNQRKAGSKAIPIVRPRDNKTASKSQETKYYPSSYDGSCDEPDTSSSHSVPTTQAEISPRKASQGSGDMLAVGAVKTEKLVRVEGLRVERDYYGLPSRGLKDSD